MSDAFNKSSKLNRVARLTLVLAAWAGPCAFGASPECVKALKAFLDKDPRPSIAAAIDAATDEPQLEAALKAAVVERRAEIRADVVADFGGCRASTEVCLAQAIENQLDPEAPKSQKFSRGFFGNLCIVKGAAKGTAPSRDLARRARSSYAQNLALGLAGLFSGYALKLGDTPDTDFPFDLTADMISGLLMRAEASCRNIARQEHYAGNPYARGTAAHAAHAAEQASAHAPGALGTGVAKTWKARFAESFVSYLPLVPATVGAYIFYVAAEDFIRGEDITSPEKLAEYAKKATLALTWDLGFNVLHILFLDKVYLEMLPGARDWINALLRNRVYTFTLRGGAAGVRTGSAAAGKTFLGVSAGEVPGYALEMGTRWGIQTLQQYSWFVLAEKLTEGERGTMPRGKGVK